MRTTNSHLALAVALTLALTACGGDDASTETTGASTTVAPSTTAAASQPTITISGFSFGDPIAATVGQEVLVSNADGTAHTWTSRDGAFDSGNLGPGGEFRFAFDTAGEYAFFCAIHGSMTGSITITG